jgi:hypothetical protein
MALHDQQMCASLPQTTYSVSWTFCGHHQSWSAFASIVHQADDEPEVRYSASQDFGPFDSFDDVERWLEVEFVHLR